MAIFDQIGNTVEISTGNTFFQEKIYFFATKKIFVLKCQNVMDNEGRELMTEKSAKNGLVFLNTAANSCDQK